MARDLTGLIEPAAALARSMQRHRNDAVDVVENVPGCRAEPQRERTRQRPASVVLQRVHDRPQ